MRVWKLSVTPVVPNRYSEVWPQPKPTFQRRVAHQLRHRDVQRRVVRLEGLDARVGKRVDLAVGQGGNGGGGVIDGDAQRIDDLQAGVRGGQGSRRGQRQNRVAGQKRLETGGGERGDLTSGQPDDVGGGVFDGHAIAAGVGCVIDIVADRRQSLSGGEGQGRVG